MSCPKRIRSAHVSVDCLHAALLAALFSCICPLALLSQTAQPQRVYGARSVTTTTSMLPAYNKDSSSGALSLLAGAPFADRLEGGLTAIDGLARIPVRAESGQRQHFDVPDWRIHGRVGGVAEFALRRGADRESIYRPVAADFAGAGDIGKLLYVGYADGDSSTTAALVPFAIDAANLRLILTSQLSLDLGNGAPVQLQSDPKGPHLYVGLGPGGNQTKFIGGRAGVLNRCFERWRRPEWREAERTWTAPSPSIQRGNSSLTGGVNRKGLWMVRAESRLPSTWDREFIRPCCWWKHREISIRAGRSGTTDLLD
jgi:hypothetical protein